MKNYATFHGYLIEEQAKGTIDFRLRLVDRPDGGLDFYIHPDGKDGETGDFEVSGNVVRPIADNMAAGSAR